MRDINKQLEQGMEVIARHPRADIKVEELRTLIDSAIKYGDGKGITHMLYNAISTSFYMGVAVGSRNSR